MPSKRRYARIAITLPVDDLASADRVAREQDRPRSWVVAEAIRQYAGTTRGWPPIVPGLGPSRLAQLVADLKLTPEARVRAAEETARATAVRPHGIVAQILSFERYEEYLEWKRRRDVRG